MRPWMVAAIGLAFPAIGCTHLALERQTARQASTITDLRYRQVLDNLAMMAHNPSMMPYYAVVTGGLTQVDDNVSASGSVTWGWMSDDFPGGSNSQMLGAGAQRTKSGNWSLDPLHDPERMLAMRCVYQTVLGPGAPKCPECNDVIRKFKLEDDLAKLPAGWFHVGCKRDVPKNACYVAQHCDTYVWVLPDGVEGLTRLSLAILDIATVDLPSLSPTKQVVKKYDGKCNPTAVEVITEVDASEPDCTPPEKGSDKGMTQSRSSAVKRRRDPVGSFRSVQGPVRTTAR